MLILSLPNTWPKYSTDNENAISSHIVFPGGTDPAALGKQLSTSALE